MDKVIIKKEDFDIEKATELFYKSLMFDPDDQECKDAIYKAQLSAIKYAEQYAVKGNNDAKRFIIGLAQGKKDTLGEFATESIKRDAFNSVQQFFGNYIKTQCINKFISANPNATYEEMDEDVNGSISSVWIEITKDFMFYNPEIAEFSTWARGRVMGGIQNYIADKKGRKSKTTLQIDKRVFNMTEELKSEGVLFPSAVLIAQRLELSVESVKNSLIRMENENKLLSIDNMYTNSDKDGYKELNLGASVNTLSEDLFSPETQIMIKENKKTLMDAVHLLSPEERYVLGLIQNVNFEDDDLSAAIDSPKMDSSDIAKVMNIPENKVVNLYSNALKKMKNYIERENSDLVRAGKKEPDTFLSNRTITFSNSGEDQDMLTIINSIDDITD